MSDFVIGPDRRWTVPSLRGFGSGSSAAASACPRSFALEREPAGSEPLAALARPPGVAREYLAHVPSPWGEDSQKAGRSLRALTPVRTPQTHFSARSEPGERARAIVPRNPAGAIRQRSVTSAVRFGFGVDWRESTSPVRRESADRNGDPSRNADGRRARGPATAVRRFGVSPVAALEPRTARVGPDYDLTFGS